MISILTTFAAQCTDKNSFLGLPSWYHYLSCQTVNGSESPQLTSLTDVWLILAAVIEILLRIASLSAVAFVVWGGIKYMTSQGDPSKTTQARTTIQNALIGLAISVLAATAVSFIAGSFK